MVVQNDVNKSKFCFDSGFEQWRVEAFNSALALPTSCRGSIYLETGLT